MVSNEDSSSCSEPHSKKAKSYDLKCAYRNWLVKDELPASLTAKSPRNSTVRMLQDHLQLLLDQHGLKTSIVRSPREALSVYKESFHAVELNTHDENCGAYVVVMFGCHSIQSALEQAYIDSWKDKYCLKCFCERMNEVCSTVTTPDADQKENPLAKLLAETRDSCIKSILGEKSDTDERSTIQRLASIFDTTIQVESQWRRGQLQHEYDRIVALNASVGNALLTKFVAHHDMVIRDIYFKRCHLPQYERLSIYLYDSQIDELKPPPIALLPSSTSCGGSEHMAAMMVASFWQHLLQRGYYASSQLRQAIAPNLEKYFLSGLTRDTNTPLLLTAHFTPAFPLSFYFYGKAGSGKSSLVRNFAPALHAVIEEFADPSVLVRYVKQNMNKPLETLQLELDLRPNNNDMSVMSIIQSKRMTLGQSKPGLVLVAMEEIASTTGDPNQLATCQLISQRFAGRKGAFREETRAPKNSAKRGISGDASIIPLCTSNYELEEPCMVALKKLKMFHNLEAVLVEAVAGSDREDFATQYLKQQLETPRSGGVVLDIPLGDGDTRPLVRYLRMLAHYINTFPTTDCALIVKQNGPTWQIKASPPSTSATLNLVVGSMGNLYPRDNETVPRNQSVVDMVSKVRTTIKDPNVLFELQFVLSFWLAGALAPTVIVSKQHAVAEAIVEAIESVQRDNVNFLKHVDASQYKMMKSLYDPPNARNLRDDILRFGKGAKVVVDLLCPTVDAQLSIREIIEDTPSQTAFSSEKSALFKSGILFFVTVGEDLTPEVASRASFIL